MNALGGAPDGVLVPKSLGLSQGDTFPLKITTDIGDVVMDVRVVGNFNLFPHLVCRKG